MSHRAAVIHLVLFEVHQFAITSAHSAWTRSWRMKKWAVCRSIYQEHCIVNRLLAMSSKRCQCSAAKFDDETVQILLTGSWCMYPPSEYESCDELNPWQQSILSGVVGDPWECYICASRRLELAIVRGTSLEEEIWRHLCSHQIHQGQESWSEFLTLDFSSRASQCHALPYLTME